MQILGLISLMLLFAILPALAQYPEVTIRQIQEVSTDSLLQLDTLQCGFSNRWTRASPYYLDTVTVTGMCVIPSRIMDHTASGFTLLLADTSSSAQWGGMFVRPNTADTALIIQWGILNVRAGDVVRFVGYIDEFPAASCVSMTQVVPILDIPLQITGQGGLPSHVSARVSEFYSGFFPGGRIRFSTGERYESMRVLIRNVSVFYRDTSGHFIGFIDSAWNTMYAYKARRSIQLPPYQNGSRIDSIRGFILTFGGQDAQRGYVLGVVDSSDVVISDIRNSDGIGSPSSFTLARNYPNPFNPSTTISFSLTTRAFVTLKIFDMLGRQVSTLISEEMDGGYYSRQWDGAGLVGGVYFCQLRTGTFVQTNKLLLLR